ncbi:PGA2-homolog [Colletotrichum sidae]|uniref:PGA2-homolog n=4 Tax=Colletotrichum orbiculare species complex TaxID=2707354 RepID=N4VNI3_COLOR|nr:PGA2-homolog [Colletotrichum orbiculare MAFF 240422]TDZ40030.1 PGA2-homolog [Colletotrichum spinosum]TDZ68446.1 PGA2-homolog [Colletotrichum trifolii]TEA18220.1 PGA2-homolog [Colletotrichum sidae]
MAGIIDLIVTIWTRFSTNLRGTLDGMTPEKWIRLVVIVGAYCLLRPYLMKLAGGAQMEQHENKPEEDGPKAKVQPNTLRGQVEIPEDSDDEEAAPASSTATDWGKKARRRQRDVLKKMIDVEEKRLAQLQEDDEDKDIEEFLVKG